MRFVEHPRTRTAFLVLVFALGLAGDAVRLSLGWWTFGVLAVAMGAASVVLLIAQRDRWRIGGLPYPLVAFLVLATLSIAWSFYPAATALGLFTTWLIAFCGIAVAVTFSWAEILRGFGLVLRAVLALSLLFELFVSVVLQRPILPLVTQPGVDYSIFEKIPKILYWSRNELFEVFDDGRIQGILGNANNLGILALFAVMVFVIQLADRTVKRGWGVFWLVVAVVVLLFTRSATVTVAAIVVALAVAAVLLLRRARTARGRTLTYVGIVGVAATAVTIVAVFQRTILDLLGKSPDLTGRFKIWNDVIEIAQQRPAQGWGWVSYWVPWAAPFDNLTFNNGGVRQLQAHDVWLDVWLQLGVIGLIVFGALVLSVFARSWSLAVDHAQSAPNAPQSYTATAVLPLLLMVALLVQSVAESRLIVEYGFFFLVLIAVKTKTAFSEPRAPATGPNRPSVSRGR